MINELDQRESRVMDFIDAKNKEQEKINTVNTLNASPEIKLRKLAEMRDKCTSDHPKRALYLSTLLVNTCGFLPGACLV